MGAAMEDHIIVQNAGKNNLQQVSVEIPKGRLVVFAGISGSGKSSLLMDTIGAEAMRQLRDTLPAYVRNRMAGYDAPDAERVDRLSTPIIINQRPLRGNVRSTVGTITDTAPLLRLLFSRCGEPEAGTSNAYSFNDPQGMCPVCSGLGYVVEFDLDKILDTDKSLNQGAIGFPGHQVGACLWQVYANSGLYSPDKPLKEFTDGEWRDFLHGSGVTVTIQNTTGKVWGDSYQQTYEGFQDRIERLYLRRNMGSLSKANQKIVYTFTKRRTCPACRGKRLHGPALKSRLLGCSIAEMGQLEIMDLLPVLRQVENPEGIPIAEKILGQLQCMADMGLGYLNLDRPADSLSGGELQRLKLVRHLGSSLVDMMYIFDEPSTGLHPYDVDRLKKLLLGLRDRGNTVLVAEHNRQIMEIADQIVELGPGAGKDGGRIVFQGSVQELKLADTITARCLREKGTLKDRVRASDEYIEIRDASLHNLKNITVKIPRNRLVVITGVAGAGKSSLVCGELLAQHPEAIYISQSPIGTGSRSNPATYSGILDEVRKLLGRANHVSPQLFSSNSKGACPVCKGRGVILTDMAFMDPVEVECERCHGKRYSEEAVSYYYIGYITLGQPTSTLSGGECQRIKLGSHLSEKGNIYLLDEPAAGLHRYDVQILLKLLNQLVDCKNTLIVVEHNRDVIQQADWIIDMGPGGGKHGGEVLFQGTPRELIRFGNSDTARYLRESLVSEDISPKQGR